MKPRNVLCVALALLVVLFILPVLPFGFVVALPAFLIFPWLICEARLHRQFKRELKLVLEAHHDELDPDSE